MGVKTVIRLLLVISAKLDFIYLTENAFRAAQILHMLIKIMNVLPVSYLQATANIVHQQGARCVKIHIFEIINNVC